MTTREANKEVRKERDAALDWLGCPAHNSVIVGIKKHAFQ